MARKRSQRRAAFRLAHDAYTGAGLMHPQDHGMRVAPFHLLPTTTIFNASLGEQLIYTMTLIHPPSSGLPAESIYPQQTGRLLRRNVRLAEVSSLAANRGQLRPAEMFRTFLGLVGLMFQFARANGVDSLVIIVHPRQRRFYERSLGFRILGERATCPWVLDKPAIALEHDFENSERTGYRCYEQVYGRRYAPAELRVSPMSPADLCYFAKSEMEFSHPAALIRHAA